MRTEILYTNKKPNKKLIKAIESVKGWFIEWEGGCVKLSADTKGRLKDLVDFFNLFIN